MATATEQILSRLDKIETNVDKRMTPIEALLKSAKEPASKLGMSPEAWLAKMYGKGDHLVGGDGVPLPYTKRYGRSLKPIDGEGKKTFGTMCQRMVEAIHPHYAGETQTKAIRELEDPNGYGMVQQKIEGQKEKAAMAEGSGLAGGYTVPVIFSEQLMYLAVEDTIVAPRARHLPMPSAELLVPSLDQTTAPTATNTQFFGGIQALWAAEAATLAEREPQVRQTALKANQISFFAVVSNILLQDNAVGLESLLTTLFPQAIGWYFDFAYFQGNGVGKPMGMLNASATIQVTRQTATRFFWIDAVTMLSKLYIRQWDLNSVVWVINPSVLPQLFMMNDAATNTTTGRAIWTPINAGAQEMPARSGGACSAGYLLGKPVLVSEKLPTLGTLGDVMLLDCSNYLIGDRMDVAVDVSPHVNFLTNQMVWRVIARGDGQPWLNNPITLQDTVNKVSPFVALL